MTTTALPFEPASDVPADRPAAGDPACIACGGTHFRTHLCGLTDYLTGESFDIRRCAACDLLVTDPPPADAGRYYPAQYRGNRHAFTGGWRVRRRAAAIEACFPTGFRGRLLDVGAGDGSFALHMRRRGWTVAATEIDPAAVDRLRAGDVDAKQPEDAERDGFDRPFDAVTSWHVLEHVEQPARTVAWVRSQLAGGGAFQATVPNVASLQARLTGRHWMHLDVPRHRQHFTPATFGELLQTAGFRVERQTRFALEYDWFGAIQSGLNVVCRRPNVLFDRLTHAPKADTDRASATDVALSYAVGLPLAAGTLPPMLLAWAAGDGATLTMTCR